jgi:hypothetical protein
MYLTTHSKAGFPSWDVTSHRTDNLQPELQRSGNEALQSSEKRNRRSETWNLKLGT